jgi:hypothetical protein
MTYWQRKRCTLQFLRVVFKVFGLICDMTLIASLVLFLIEYLDPNKYVWGPGQIGVWRGRAVSALLLVVL